VHEGLVASGDRIKANYVMQPAAMLFEVVVHAMKEEKAAPAAIVDFSASLLVGHRNATCSGIFLTGFGKGLILAALEKADAEATADASGGMGRSCVEARISRIYDEVLKHWWLGQMIEQWEERCGDFAERAASKRVRPLLLAFVSERLRLRHNLRSPTVSLPP
jgi:hypothetical protein